MQLRDEDTYATYVRCANCSEESVRLIDPKDGEAAEPCEVCQSYEVSRA